MVGVILPSRGLLFSQTGEEIMQNVKGIGRMFYFAHRRPLPECFEEPTNRALANKNITHLWYVEEDMILPSDTLKRMLEQDKAVVTADYPTTDYGGGAVFKVKGQIIFGGTGCTLVKREVFDELKKPYFTTDICWNIKNYGDFIKIIAVPKGNTDGYGLHDVNFFMNLYRLEIPVHDAGFTVGQRKLKALGKQGTNDGAHQIDEWTKIKKDDLLKKVMKWPVEQKGNMTTVLVEGRELMCTFEHAEKLIKKGIGTRPPKRAVVVDDSGIL